jgi:hypothetical protein
MSVHRPFDDHTLQLLNAAVWSCESRRPNGRYEWRVIGARMDESRRQGECATPAASNLTCRLRNGKRG